ncbi:MAG: polysaccharide biosynthesis/export family protein [Sedimentisphaerales bacterium]
MKRKTGLVVFFSACVLVGAAGCSDKFWDPTQVGRFRPVPAVNIILDSLGVAEETPAAWETGEDPTPADVIAYDTDYVFGPGDVVNIGIFELFNEGAIYANQFIVTETGKISIPDVGVVEASGLTESQLEEEIKQILSPNILKEPSVNVTLLRSQSRMFSIFGAAVPRPSRYELPRYDFRLTDALATAGGIGQFNTSFIYVSRPITGQEALTEPAASATAERQNAPPPPKAAPKGDSHNEMLDIVAPSVHTGPQGIVVASSEMVTGDELAELYQASSPDKIPADTPNTPAGTQKTVTRDSTPVAQNANDQSQATGNDSRIEWIFQDGRWVPVQIPSSPKTPSAQGAAKQAESPAKSPRPKDEVNHREVEQQPTGTEWNQIGGVSSGQRRVIRIPADKLLSGDPRYNIVIRPNDNIHVPLDIIGEFCIMGNINAQGFINMTGRPMTLKMAVAAAGGLGPLAWPKKCEVVRRIAKNREEIVMVDLDKIAAGEQPDFFIKPNDLINVGTHPSSNWRYILRNSFRATYGFGFLYDRNFADRHFGLNNPLGPFGI